MTISFQDKLPNPVQKVKEFQIVKTPLVLASRILDNYPAHVWQEKDWHWLVPVSKTGVFELGIFVRLMKGLEQAIPDWETRRNWIIKEMIWSFAPTPACELLVRRNYLAKVWNNIDFSNLEGNVSRCDFLTVTPDKNGAIMVRDNSGNKKYVKFDCIVGNPPFQKDSGDTSDVAFYPLFVLQAMQMQPAYMSMVIPAKWMLGDGKGVAEFLSKMLECGKISSIFTTENSREWFPDIDLRGGAMYFLYDGSMNDTNTTINGTKQNLADADIIVTDPIALAIKDKILPKSTRFFNTVMFGQNPYGINTNHDAWAKSNDTYVCHTAEGSGKGAVTKLIDKNMVSKNVDTIDKWKLCIAKNSGKGRDGTGHAFIAAPGAITTQSYLVFATFDSEVEVKNAYAYVYTHFAQFMSSITKGTQNVSKRIFKWLPYLDFTKSYTDAELYATFELTLDEIAHIENKTKDLPIFRVHKTTKQIAKKAA